MVFWMRFYEIYNTLKALKNKLFEYQNLLAYYVEKK